MENVIYTVSSVLNSTLIEHYTSASVTERVWYDGCVFCYMVAIMHMLKSKYIST